jgi:transposase-like protein
MMNLRTLVEKTPQVDLLREMIGIAADRLMNLGAGAATGAGSGEKRPLRTAQRSSYRERDWEIRADTVELHVPDCARAAASPASWSHGACRRRR